MLIASTGQASAFEAHLAGVKAASEAVRGLGRYEPGFAILAVSHEYPLERVLQGAAPVLGDATILAFSTSGEFASAGVELRSVALAVLAGDDLRTRGGWWPGFNESPRDCVGEMLMALQPQSHPKSLLLLAGEGLGGEAATLAAALPPGDYSLAGCLAGGDVRVGRTFQAGGRPSPPQGGGPQGGGPQSGSPQSGSPQERIPPNGSGGLAAVLLEGRLVLGVGAAHGWSDVGAYARITRARGPWVRQLDGRSPAEVYGQYFGFPEREWAFPPLNRIVRLYPLGVVSEDETAFQVRSPLRVEADGSLRMGTPLREGSMVHILVGSQDACLSAAKLAAQEALEALGGARPTLALLLVDAAWQTLLQATPGVEVEAVRAVLGDDLPLVGGYTTGQVARQKPGGAAQLLNNHILVALIAEQAS